MKYQKLITNGIKRLREKLGLKQEDFSEKINLTPQGLSNIERNRYQPKPETIDKICEVFNIHPVDLLMEYPDDMETKELILQINAVLQTLSKKDLKKACKIITALKD